MFSPVFRRAFFSKSEDELRLRRPALYRLSDRCYYIFVLTNQPMGGDGRFYQRVAAQVDREAPEGPLLMVAYLCTQMSIS